MFSQARWVHAIGQDARSTSLCDLAFTLHCGHNAVLPVLRQEPRRPIFQTSPRAKITPSAKYGGVQDEISTPVRHLPDGVHESRVFEETFYWQTCGHINSMRYLFAGFPTRRLSCCPPNQMRQKIFSESLPTSGRPPVSRFIQGW